MKLFRVKDNNVEEVRDGILSDLFKNVMTIEKNTHEIKNGLEEGIDKVDAYNHVVNSVSNLLRAGEDIADFITRYAKNRKKK